MPILYYYLTRYFIFFIYHIKTNITYSVIYLLIMKNVKKKTYFSIYVCICSIFLKRKISMVCKIEKYTKLIILFM